MEEQEITNGQIANGLNVLAENQNRINQKIDSILDIMSNQHNQINDMKTVINQQSIALNYINNQFDNLNSKIADMQIQYLNSISDVSDLQNNLSDISNQIEGIRQLLSEWKFYSEL